VASDCACALFGPGMESGWHARVLRRGSARGIATGGSASKLGNEIRSAPRFARGKKGHPKAMSREQEVGDNKVTLSLAQIIARSRIRTRTRCAGSAQLQHPPSSPQAISLKTATADAQRCRQGQSEFSSLGLSDAVLRCLAGSVKILLKEASNKTVPGREAAADDKHDDCRRDEKKTKAVAAVQNRSTNAGNEVAAMAAMGMAIKREERGGLDLRAVDWNAPPPEEGEVLRGVLQLRAPRDPRHADFGGWIDTDTTGERSSVGVAYEMERDANEPNKAVIAWRFYCPRCEGLIDIPERDLNCRIIRHGKLQPHENLEKSREYALNGSEGYFGGCGAAIRFDNGRARLVPHTT
jgi:hypothetical protein